MAKTRINPKTTVNYDVSSVDDPYGESFTVKRAAVRRARKLNKEVLARFPNAYDEMCDGYDCAVYSVTARHESVDGYTVNYGDVDLDTGRIDWC